MLNNPVLFIDSGVGGLPYCIDFHNNNPNEAVYYIADNKNFPYGPRGKNELTSILITLIEKLLIKVNPKIIVLACNTATITAIASLRSKFPQMPFVGTVPALKPAAKSSSKRKVGVLGTARTIEDMQSLKLADDTCEIIGIAAPELVDFIEKHFDSADENKKRETAKKYIDLFRSEGADSLVLGCTHFLFLLEEFRLEASPDIEVFDSLEGITKRIEFLLDENALRADEDFKPSCRLVLTSDSADSLWQTRAKRLGFELNLLNEI